MSTDFDEFADLIDVRDVIERVEELRAYTENALDRDGEFAELSDLESLLKQLRGNGGDHEWEGDWYPVTLIRDSYFTDYAQELAEDIGAIQRDQSWPISCIDWDRAARELRMDYTAVEFRGATYWTR